MKNVGCCKNIYPADLDEVTELVDDLLSKLEPLESIFVFPDSSLRS